MKLYRKLLIVLVSGLVLALTSCGHSACDALPFCLTPQTVEPQPSGLVLDATGRGTVVTLYVGESVPATLTINRDGLSTEDPVYLVPTVQAGGTGVLAIIAGVSVSGTQTPFTSPTTSVTVSAAQNAMPGTYNLYFGVRRTASKYPDTRGPVMIQVIVQ